MEFLGRNITSGASVITTRQLRRRRAKAAGGEGDSGAAAAVTAAAGEDSGAVNAGDSGGVNAGDNEVVNSATAKLEQQAFAHALREVGELNEAAAEALVMFFRAFASTYGVPVRRAMYSFVLYVVNELDQWYSDEGAGSKDKASSTLSSSRLGDVARQLAAYPVMAHYLMASGRGGAIADMDPLRRIPALCALLDERLVTRESKQEWAGREIESLRCTRLAARCAVPFAFGLKRLIPNEQLDFIMRNVVNGELKSVRYALTYVLKGDGTQDGDSDRDSESSEPEGEDDEDEDDDEEEGDNEVVNAAAGDSRVERAAGAAGAAKGTTALPPREPIYMRHELSEREFRAILRRIKADYTFDMLHAFGFHGPPYFEEDEEGTAEPKASASADPAARFASARKRIMAGKPFAPPCRGSVLRAYCREVVDVSVDAKEPAIQAVADCVV